MIDPSPIFIISNRRSGSTLLRLMLTSHPNIVIPPEGDFLVRMGWKYDRRYIDKRFIDDFIDDLFKMENIQDWEFERDSLLQRLHLKKPNTYPEIIRQLYLEYDRIKNNSASSRWGDKTTWYADYLHQIQGYFPEMLVIHLVRDPRAVAASYKDVPHLPSNVVRAGMDWLWHEHRISQAEKSFSPDKWLLVRYEDLVEEPLSVLQIICDFIGESFHPDMLDYWRRNRAEQLEPERHLGWKQKTLQKVTASQVDRWKQRLTPKEQYVLNQITYKARKEYGYDFAHEQSPWPLSFYWSLRWGMVLLYRTLLELLRESKARILVVLNI